jgi:hypothetical protein
MRYRLRTLLIALAVGPLLLWAAFWLWQKVLAPPSDVFIHDSWIKINGKRVNIPDDSTP